MNITAKIENAAKETGFLEIGYVNIGTLKYYPEVRSICEKNSCGGYGASWACPPATGTLEECRSRVEQYKKMLVFTQMYKLEDSFDYEGMVEGGRSFKKLAEAFKYKLDNITKDCLLLANEGCRKCEVCTYPDAPCRFPELLFPPLEGYGFIVSELSREAGVKYNNGSETVTYFGAVLFNEE